MYTRYAVVSPHRRRFPNATLRLQYQPCRASSTTRGLHLQQLRDRCLSNRQRRPQGPSISWPASRLAPFSSYIPPILTPPAVFLALLVGLWTYKCIMTILFQDKIIYMPYMPPFARSEKIKDYTAICQPVQWSTTHIKSLDGTKIALCCGQLPKSGFEEGAIHGRRKRIAICYFQGNGSSTPPRLPLLSSTLKAIDLKAATGTNMNIDFIVVALSYRGYWTSSGRASQRGIEKDAAAMLEWVTEKYAIPGRELDLVLWGQSIGSGVAVAAAADYVTNLRVKEKPPITALVLETPFTSIRSMLLAIYPQRWLPYRYLWPFLWNHWDSEAALRKIAQAGLHKQPGVLLLSATRDEVVPSEEVGKLEQICNELDLSTTRAEVAGALHFEATMRKDGQKTVAEFIVKTVEKGGR